MLTFHDPRAEPGASIEPYELSVDITAGAPTIGLVANGFPDSEAFLDQIEKAMAVAVPTASFRRWNKYNASSMISDEMLDEVVADCTAVIGAYGHWGSCTTGTVRDGVKIARRGVPSVALVTEEFWPQGDFVARSVGMPDVPRLRLPHPVAGSGVENMASVAEGIVAELIEMFAA